jgi:hypothetical protein
LECLSPYVYVVKQEFNSRKKSVEVVNVDRIRRTSNFNKSEHKVEPNKVQGSALGRRHKIREAEWDGCDLHETDPTIVHEPDQNNDDDYGDIESLNLNNGNVEFEVVGVLGEKVVNGKRQYKIRWATGQVQWIEEERMGKCQRLIKEFHQRRK